MKIYEEYSGGMDKPDNAMIKELQSLEDENSQIKEQLTLLQKDYEIAQQQLVTSKPELITIRRRKRMSMKVVYWRKDRGTMN